jgi:hypothetical protein
MSSPSLKDEVKTSNNAEATICNRDTNRPPKGATRHFPELGILAKMPNAAFSTNFRSSNGKSFVFSAGILKSSSLDFKLKVRTQRRRAKYAIVSHILRDVFTDLQMDQLLLLLSQTYGAAFLVHGLVE